MLYHLLCSDSVATHFYSRDVFFSKKFLHFDSTMNSFLYRIIYVELLLFYDNELQEKKMHQIESEKEAFIAPVKKYQGLLFGFRRHE